MSEKGRIGLFGHVRSIMALLFVAAGVLTTGCQDKPQPPPPAAPVVRVMTVEPKDVPVVFEYVAQTQSSHLVNIQARVSGFLDKRVYTEGSMVKERQILFQMDPKPFQVQLNQAKAALAKQEAANETARLDLARVKPLTEQNALSQKDLDDARGRYLTTSAAVAQAQAQVDQAELNLSYTTIRSPVNGISSSALQTDGTYINPQNSLLTTVAVLSPMWVNFSISENEMQTYERQIDKGLLRPPPDHEYEVEIVLVDGSIFPYRGRMTFAEPSYNPQTGTFLIRVSVKNPKEILRPNQYVRVRLIGTIRPHAILVPQRAVQQGSKGQFVWVVGTDDQVEERPVTVGEWHGDDWFIFEGLEAGEQVVVDGALTLRPGVSVETKPYALDQASKTTASRPPEKESAPAGK
jgi:membrane fusion protein, multidrug efflux system